MRTTFNIEDGLFADLKQLAAETEQTVTSVIHDLLREALWRRRDAKGAPPDFDLPVFQGDGTQPGVDITDNAGLLAILEGDDGPS